MELGVKTNYSLSEFLLNIEVQPSSYESKLQHLSAWILQVLSLINLDIFP